jgi:hypothetical protein
MTAMLGIMLWAVIPLTLQRIASAALRASGNVYPFGDDHRA